MKVYIAGPMRGYAEFNFPAFHEAEAYLKGERHYQPPFPFEDVFNPARRDEEDDGIDVTGTDGDEEKLAKEQGFCLRKALYEDTKYICLTADAIYMLKGWEQSGGCPFLPK